MTSDYVADGKVVAFLWTEFIDLVRDEFPEAFKGLFAIYGFLEEEEGLME